jgi:serine protease
MRLTSIWTRAIAAIVLGLATLLSYNTTGHASASLPLTVNGAHILWNPADAGAPTVDPNQAGGPLIYHGGRVLTNPAAYLVFWGPTWKTGFALKDQGFTYTNRSVMNYITGFFANVGGTPWAHSQTQYCDNVTPGTSCSGQPFAQYVTNPKNQLKGVWVDSSPIPSSITTTALAENSTNDDLANEAIKASQHFGYNINAVYFILTQPGIMATAYGSVYCAYHNETSHTTGHAVYYAFVPFSPDGGCFDNSVNAKDNAFGNGYLDGYSIAAGHEYEEAITDPDNLDNTQDGWNDAKTFETGDKCESNFQNLKLGTHYYAVQPLWSNAANAGQGGCVMSG